MTRSGHRSNLATPTTIANTSVIIRREQERGAKIEVVRSALIEGEETGKPKHLDANAFKRKLRRVSTGFPLPNTSATDDSRHTLLARIPRSGSLATTRRAQLLDESTLYRT
jgi:hypothetical protein